MIQPREIQSLPVCAARVVFDFDGVLALTNWGKACIFADAMLIRESDRGAFERRFIATGGTGRRRKMIQLWFEFHGRAATAEELTRAETEIASRTIEMVLRTGLVPGVDGALRRLRARGLTPSVVSGTPSEELERYLGSLGVRELFSHVLGSPTRKHEHLRSLRGDAEAARCIYLGDTAEDAASAAEAGWSFVLVGEADAIASGAPLPGQVVARLFHANELPGWLDNVEAYA